MRDEDELQMKVGGQEIGTVPTANTQPFMRPHNLRYSSAFNEFAICPESNSISGVMLNATTAGELSPRSELSLEKQDRQNQAMKLLNEDNPFANPEIKPQSVVQMASVAIFEKATGGSDERQAMSFGVDGVSKSITDRTTERESKNTNATLQTAIGLSSAASANLTNHFKSTQNHRRLWA